MASGGIANAAPGQGVAVPSLARSHSVTDDSKSMIFAVKSCVSMMLLTLRSLWIIAGEQVWR